MTPSRARRRQEPPPAPAPHRRADAIRFGHSTTRAGGWGRAPGPRAGWASARGGVSLPHLWHGHRPPRRARGRGPRAPARRHPGLHVPGADGAHESLGGLPHRLLLAGRHALRAKGSERAPPPPSSCRSTRGAMPTSRMLAGPSALRSRRRLGRDAQRPSDRRRTTTPAAFMPNTEVTKATLPSICVRRSQVWKSLSLGHTHMKPSSES